MYTVWTFETKRFLVELLIEQEYGYQYDGDDENGETQAALNSGELVAFDSVVRVSLDGNVIGTDALGGSVYYADKVPDFWTKHRGDYFHDMVRAAINEARKVLRNNPRMRK